MVEFFSIYWPGMVAVAIAFGIPGSVAVGCWRDHRRQMKLEKHPERMDTLEYQRYNRERFNK
jgi:hypothetical protein